MVIKMNDSLDLRNRILKMRENNNLNVTKQDSFNNNPMSEFESSNQDDNKKTKEILEKHKVLVKYCKVHPYGFRDNWCRMTIQPGLSEQEFFKELING